MGRYDSMTQDEFTAILEQKVAAMTAAEILAVPGCYEALSEELNNAVLSAWEEDHPEPDDDDED